MSQPTARPWYRHVWPWLLIVPPAGAVIGGGITLYLAVTRPDALVRKDCVRDGVTMVCGEEARRLLEAAGRDEGHPRWGSNEGWKKSISASRKYSGKIDPG